MKKIISIVLLVVFLMLLGCEAHMHKIGQGAQNNEMEEARQWYILFGLVPLNEVDTSEMVGEVEDYTIETETSVLDVVMNIFTMYVTVSSRTVTVTK